MRYRSGRQALQHSETRTEAAEAIRGLIDAIVLMPTDGALEAHVVRRGRQSRPRQEARRAAFRIELRGKLAAMLTAAQTQRGHRKPVTSEIIAESDGCGGGIRTRDCRHTTGSSLPMIKTGRGLSPRLGSQPLGKEAGGGLLEPMAQAHGLTSVQTSPAMFDAVSFRASAGAASSGRRSPA